MYTTLIDPDELALHVNDDSWVILDARFSLADTTQGRRAFDASRISGARYAHLDDDLSGPIIPGETGRHPMPDRAALADRFRAWGIRNTTQIVVYDDKVGAVAARLWWLSKWLGHDACAVLNGGFADWSTRGLPVDDGASAQGEPVAHGDPVRPGVDDFSASDPGLTLIDIDEAASGQWQLIDAREAARYAGVHEPIDPVAGHIRGALNRPFMLNVDDSGRFLSRATLRSQFADLTEKAEGKPPGHYCGSGVTAAHNILAMVHAGLDPGALYAGSFSEWVTRNPADYPVAKVP